MLRKSKIVQRHIEADKQFSGWFTCKKKLTAILRSCLFVFLCLVMISQILLPSAAFAASSERAKSNTQPDYNYLLDRVITWADGSTEHVQIGKDGFFHLNGEKKKLVGISLGLLSVPIGDYGQFYLPSNMAMYEKELAYLQFTGVRLIPFSLPYIKHLTKTIEAEQKAYKDILDLLYRYKMLVIPLIGGKGSPDFGSLQVLDFPIGKDSMGQWATRWIDIVSRYENVVGITAENELDLKRDPSVETYTAKEVAAYMSFLTGILRTKFNGPIVSKLTAWYGDEPEIKKTCLNATDLGAFDCYADNKTVMDSKLTKLQARLSSSGFPMTGWWCMELNYHLEKIDSAYINIDLIESVFNHGAGIAILWTSNTSAKPAAQFFNNDGSPITKLVELARDFNTLQAPVIEPVIVASNTKK